MIAATMMWLMLLLALSPAFVGLTASAPGSSCLAEDIVLCRDTLIADMVSFRNSRKKVHNPFSVSLRHSSPVGSHKYHVEVSGNDPEAQIVAFVLQVCSHENHETNKFTSTGNESWKIVSCINPDDTVIQLISAPKPFIAVDFVSKSTTVSLRYLLVDDNMAVYKGTQMVSLASTVISQHSNIMSNNHIRRKRVTSDDPSAYLLMANGDYLHKISLDGNQVQTPVLVDQSNDNILDIDYHYRQRFLYWTDNMAGKIMRANLDGSGVSTVIEEGLMEPDGLSVDWVTNKLYFTDTVLDIVGVFDLESNLFKVLISTLGDSNATEPRAIVVDPSTRWVYWTDWGNPAKIERASMDGRNRTVLHNTGLVWPNGITLDYSRQVLYWVDASEDVLQSSNVDGSNRITLANQATGLSHTFGITFINDILFFTDWNGNRLQSIPMSGSALTTVFDGTCTVPYGLVAVSDSRQSDLTNTCSGSSCSQLCLLSSIDPRGYSCSCRDGYSLAANQQNCFLSGNVTDYSSSELGTCMAAGHSTCCVGGDCGGSPLSCYCDANCHVFGDCCQDVPTDCISAGSTPYLVYASEPFIHLMTLPVNATDTQVRTRIIVSGLSRAADIDFHYRDGYLYWSDVTKMEVWRSNFDGSGAVKIMDTGSSPATDIAVDWVTNKLYWVNGTDSTINIFDLTSGSHATVLTVDGTVTDIALHPGNREMYISVSGSTPRIEKASMDGSNRVTFQAMNISLPSSLTIDNSLEVVWADTQLNRIESATFDGLSRGVAYSESSLPARDPMSFTIHLDTLYFVGFFVGVYAARTDSNPRLLSNVGCTLADSIQVISSARQPLVSNPCADNNGGCSTSEMCVLSIDGHTCLTVGTTVTPLPTLGTCAAAGITECCVTGSCMGNPPTCSCSTNCQLFRSCCSDVITTCTTEPTTDTPQVTASVVITGPESPSELDNISIECSIRANPRAEITWLLVKVSLTEAARILSGPRISIIENDQATNILQIAKVTAADNGVYVCEADNGIGSPGTGMWDLRIISVDDCLDGQPCQNGGTCVDKVGGYSCVCPTTFRGTTCQLQDLTQLPPSLPVIESHPSSTSVALASSLNLTCSASGSPSPGYSWYKDGELVLGETMSFLYISEAHPEDRGDYTCKATNDVGEDVSNPASVNVPGVLQYTTQVRLSTNSTSLLSEAILVLASSELADTDSDVFSVIISNITRVGNSFEATVYVSLVTPQDQPGSEQVARIRESLTSELRQTQYILSADDLIRVDGCTSEEYMGYSWPETHLGTMATAACPCAEILGDSAGEVKRFCGGTFSRGGEWREGLDVSCETTLSEVSRQLCDIASEVSANQSVQASRDVLNITSSPQNLTTSHVTLATSVVEQLTEEAATNPEVRDNYLLTIDNIQQADADVIVESQVTMNTTLRILDSLGTFLDNLDITTVNSSGNLTTFTFSTYALQVQEVDPDSFNGQTFIVNLGSVEQAVNSSGVIEQESLLTVDGVANDISGTNTELSQNGSTASLQLTPEIFENCVSNESSTNSSSVVSQRLSYSVFVSDVLFLPENRTLNQVGSIVVAVRLRCQLANKTMLIVPVRSTFRVSDGVAKSSCAVYKTEDRFGAWNTDGCREVARSDGTLECKCTHLGHFGILLDLNPTSLPEALSVILSVVTFVGLGLSIICLVVFFLTYLLSKKLRMNTHGHVLVHMSVSLLGLYVTFLIAGFTTGVPGLCGVMSALVQYFFLVFFAWTMAESIFLYLKLVTVLESYSFTFRYTLKSAIPAWLIPVLIVAVSGGAGHQFYTSRYYCRPTEWPFYFGFILPFLVAYVFNWIFFVLIMISICRHKRNMNVLKEKEKTSTENVREFKVKFIIALSLAVVLGLGWVFGLVATSSNVVELTFTLQIIFGVFVGSQGVLIFILHGVRNKDFREFWARFVPGLRKQLPRDTISSERGQIKSLRFKGGSGTDSITFSNEPAMKNGSRNESIALSDHSSITQNTDLLSKRQSSTVTYVSEGSSIVQSPTDSVFKTDSEMFSNLIPHVEPSRMKHNESKPTVQAIGSAKDPGPQYEEILPGNGGTTTSLPMTRNKSYQLHTVQAARNPGPQYEEILPGIGNPPQYEEVSLAGETPMVIPNIAMTANECYRTVQNEGPR